MPYVGWLDDRNLIVSGINCKEKLDIISVLEQFYEFNYTDSRDCVLVLRNITKDQDEKVKMLIRKVVEIN